MQKQVGVEVPVCPELAVGYRAGLIAQNDMGLTRDNARDFFILAENMSSAIDALQYMTGCTIGNQSFYAYDWGKHVYYFGRFQVKGSLAFPAGKL